MASQSEAKARGYETWQTTAPGKGGCRNELGTRAGALGGCAGVAARGVVPVHVEETLHKLIT